MDATQIVLITILSVGILVAVFSGAVRSLDVSSDNLWVELFVIIGSALFIYLIARS